MAKKKIKILVNAFDFFKNAIEISSKEIHIDYYFTKVPYRYTIFNDYFEMKKMLKSGKFDKYDVIHINNWVNFLLIKHRRPGQVWIAQSHGLHFGIDFWGALADASFFMKIIGFFFGAAFHFPIKRALKKFDAYYVAIPNCLDAAKKVRKDASWIPNPIDSSFFKKHKKINFGKGPNIFFPTRLHKMKMPEKGLEIFDAIKIKFPSAKLHVIRYPERYSQYSYYGPMLEKYGDSIIWHDFFKREDLPSAYCSFDLVLGAFGKGLLNLVELEAMASGAAVVSYDRYEFINKKMSELPEFAIKLLSDSKFRMKYVEESRNYVKKVHSDHVVSRIYLNNIKLLMKKHQNL